MKLRAQISMLAVILSYVIAQAQHLERQILGAYQQIQLEQKQNRLKVKKGIEQLQITDSKDVEHLIAPLSNGRKMEWDSLSKKLDLQKLPPELMALISETKKSVLSRCGLLRSKICYWK